MTNLVNGKRTIIVEDYNLNWPKEFATLRSRIENVIKSWIIDIEHIGSTSIPGLAAKPIIDIVIVGEQEHFEKIKQGLQQLGYFHAGDLGLSGREVFKIPPELKKEFYQHNLYFCNPKADELGRYHAFLSYLRKNPNTLQEYSEIKKLGAQKHPYDIEGYMDYKGEFLAKYLALALTLYGNSPLNPEKHCPTCRSNNIKGEFYIKYLGDGYKSENFKEQCLKCDHTWNVEIK